MMKKIFLLFVSFFLFSVPVFAEQMAEDVQVEFIDDFSAGLITDISSRKIPKNASPSMENFFIDQNLGQLQKRAGIEILGSTPTLAYVNFIQVFNKRDGSKEYIISDGSTVLTTQDFNNYVRIRGGLNQSFNMRSAQVEDKIWFTNGTDDVFTWDGTTVTVLDGRTYSGIATPDVPNGKIITYYQGRVFIGNTSVDASALHFSAVSSTGGTAINADDSRAWPAINELLINSGDGQVLTGFSKLNGVLNVWKNRSVYSLQGTDEFSYFARIQNDEVGSLSQESIVNLENIIYTIGEDDILAFDGNDYVPLTDHNRNEFQYIKTGITRTGDLFWESQADFDRGVFSNTISSPTGVLTLPGTQIVAYAGSTTAFIRENLSLDELDYYRYLSTAAQTTDDRQLYYIKNITVNGCRGQDTGNTLKLDITNLRTGVSIINISTTFVACSITPPTQIFLSSYTMVFSTTQVAITSFTASDLRSGAMQLKFFVHPNSAPDPDPNRATYIMGTGGSVDLSTPEVTIELTLPTTGMFVSEIATASALSQWDRFNSLATTNNGTITYFFKTSTAMNIMGGIPWTPIAPGAIVSSSQNAMFFQWSTTMTNITGSPPPEIDNVDVFFITGNGSLTRPFAAKWKNRYYLGVSTLTAAMTQLVYVKSRQISDQPKALAKFANINARVFATDGADLFMAGSSTAGIVFRLDYGLDDLNSPTQAYYDIPDLLLGSPYYKKEILKYFFDIENDDGMSLQVDTYLDGSLYSSRTVPMPVAGRNVYSLNNVNANGTSLRLRLINNDLGKSLKINSVGIFYKPTTRGP